jgi:hypothetical protein
MTYQMEIYMYKGANHPRLSEGPVYGFTEVLKKDMEIHDRGTHRRLKKDLIEHVRQKFGDQQPTN